MAGGGVSKPWRHFSLTYVRGDGAGEGSCLCVGDERHRCDLTGTVANLAVVLQDGKYVAIKRWRSRFIWNCANVLRRERYWGGAQEDECDGMN